MQLLPQHKTFDTLYLYVLNMLTVLFYYLLCSYILFSRPLRRVCHKQSFLDHYEQNKAVVNSTNVRAKLRFRQTLIKIISISRFMHIWVLDKLLTLMFRSIENNKI